MYIALKVKELEGIEGNEIKKIIEAAKIQIYWNELDAKARVEIPGFFVFQEIKFLGQDLTYQEEEADEVEEGTYTATYSRPQGIFTKTQLRQGSFINLMNGSGAVVSAITEVPMIPRACLILFLY